MPTNVISDEQLIRKYLSGDHGCLEKLIHRHKSKVYSYIVMLVKDGHLADDIFQDAFIKVIHTLRMGTYREEGKFLPWVMRIAHNLIIDYYRKSKRLPIAEQGSDFDVIERVTKVHDEPWEDRLITEQIHTDIRSLVQLLPLEQREVLIMRHYADLSFKEIADQTNVSINTALGRMRYALINLRKLIKEKDLMLSK